MITAIAWSAATRRASTFLLCLLLGWTGLDIRSALAQAPIPEIVELARALKNDPDLIYEYVYNNIDTLPQFGSLKGAVGALIDGKGTAHDQTELMVALLQQSGYSAGVVTGMILLPPQYLAEWLGTDDASPGSVAAIFGSGGFDGTVLGSSTLVTGAIIDWAWVYVDIGGTRYVFDPSTKILTRSPGECAGLPSALGYARSTFLAGAESGATVTPTSITGLNRANIRGALTTYSVNLAQNIRGNCPAASTQEIVGGKTITPLPVGTQVRRTSLAIQCPYPPPQCPSPQTSSSMPNNLRTTLKLEFGSNDPVTNSFTSLSSPVTFNSSDIYARRIAVSFDASAVPSLLIDGTVQMTATGTVPSGRQLTIRASIVHPYLTTFKDVTDDDHMRVKPDALSLYIIGTGWGHTGRGMVEKRRRALLQNIAQDPGNPSSEAVLGGSLAMLGYNWLAEVSQQMAVLEQVAAVNIIYHHAVGVIGMKAVGGSTGPFVDLPINDYSFIQRHGRPVPVPPAPPPAITPKEVAAFRTALVFASVAESGTIEQTQPGAIAASTVKLIDTVVQSGGTIFDINNHETGGSQSYYTSTIRPLLVAGGYAPSDLSHLDKFVNSDARVVAPANGSIAVNQYSGAGYYVLSQDGTQFGAVISGGLSGGEPATPVPPQEIVDNTPATVTPAPAQSPTITIPYQSLGNAGGNLGYTPVSLEPINLVTGDYLSTTPDLFVGSRAMPYGLVFQRYYDSGSRFQRGPLGPAWTHNLAVTALANSDAYEGLAVNSPINGASAIAALYVVFDVFDAEATIGKSLESMVIATVAQRWLMDQLTGNVVAVSQPGLVEHFVKLADDSYNPPFGAGARLTTPRHAVEPGWTSRTWAASQTT